MALDRSPEPCLLESNILPSLVGSQLSIIPVKSKLNWPKGLGGDSIYSKLFTCSFFSSGCHFVHQSRTVLAVLIEGHLSNIPMKFE